MNYTKQIIVLIFLFVCLDANATPVLDQSLDANNGLGLVVPGAQTFTVGIDGLLSGFELKLSGRSDEVRSYTVGLSRTNLDGSPLADYTSEFLYSSSGDIFEQNSSWIFFDMPDIAVHAGDMFAIYMINTSSIGNFGNDFYKNTSAEDDKYTGGKLWIDDSLGAGKWTEFRDFGADVSFRTYVIEVSSPKTINLFLSAFPLILFISRALRQ